MATVVDQNVTFRLDAPGPPGLYVPGAVLELYQPRLGPTAVSLWLNLRWMALVGLSLPSGSMIPRLCEQMGAPTMQVLEAMDALLVYELLRVEGDLQYVLQEPLGADAFLARFGEADPEPGKAADLQPGEVASRPGEVAPRSPGGAEPPDIRPGEVSPDRPRPAGDAVGAERRIVWDEDAGGGADAVTEAKDAHEADLSAVMGMYHKKIGMIGPTQFEKLRWWVDEQSMSAEVIALAIEETARNAEMPTIQYLESVLRNWHNAGVRAFEDLLKRQGLSRSLRGSLQTTGAGSADERAGEGDGRSARTRPFGEFGARGRGARFEGMANASAYQEADPERLKRWKELYADEH